MGAVGARGHRQVRRERRYLAGIDLATSASASKSLLFLAVCCAPVSAAIGALWKSQNRILCFDGVACPEAQKTGSSLPQGDRWSVPRAFLASQRPGLKAQAYFDPLQIIFVNDHSLACDSSKECALVWDFWKEKSVAL